MFQRVLVAVLAVSLVLVGCGVNNQAPQVLDASALLQAAAGAEDFEHALKALSASGEELNEESAIAFASNQGARVVSVPTLSRDYSVRIVLDAYDHVESVVVSRLDGSVFANVTEGWVAYVRVQGGGEDFEIEAFEVGPMVGTSSLTELLAIDASLKAASACSDCAAEQQAVNSAWSDVIFEGAMVNVLEEAAWFACVFTPNALACVTATAAVAQAMRSYNRAQDALSAAQSALDACQSANDGCGSGGGGNSGGR